MRNIGQQILLYTVYSGIGFVPSCPPIWPLIGPLWCHPLSDQGAILWGWALFNAPGGRLCEEDSSKTKESSRTCCGKRGQAKWKKLLALATNDSDKYHDILMNSNTILNSRHWLVAKSNSNRKRDVIERGMQIVWAAKKIGDLLPLLTRNQYDSFIFILQFNS